MVFGALFRVERFTLRKFMGVIASLIGIILISRVDLSGPDTGDAGGGSEGSFPHKSPGEIALGDAMAAFSSVLYGLYTVVMKKQVGDETRVNMPLFFGLVGFFNIILLWPGFFILHWAGMETFSLPETSRVWFIILVCLPALLFTFDSFANLTAISLTRLHHLSLILLGLTLCFLLHRLS
jgi:solute carrier family 35 protein F5